MSNDEAGHVFTELLRLGGLPMSNEPDHSEVLGTWSLMSRINGKQEFLGDVSIEKLQWDLGGRVYRVVIENEEELKNLFEVLKKKFGDGTQSRDERVREYWKLPESERATYGVIRDSRGDILALEPNAVVGIVDGERRPFIYTSQTLRDMGFYDLAEVVAGPDNAERQLVAGMFTQYGMTPAEINARKQGPNVEINEESLKRLEEQIGNLYGHSEEPSECVEE